MKEYSRVKKDYSGEQVITREFDGGVHFVQERYEVVEVIIFVFPVIGSSCSLLLSCRCSQQCLVHVGFWGNSNPCVFCTGGMKRSSTTVPQSCSCMAGTPPFRDERRPWPIISRVFSSRPCSAFVLQCWLSKYRSKCKMCRLLNKRQLLAGRQC